MYIPWGGTRTLPQGCTVVSGLLFLWPCIPSLPWLVSAGICPLELRQGHGGWSLYPTNKNVCSVVFNSLGPQGPDRFLCPWESPGKNTRGDCHFLLQEIFQTQGSNPRPLYLLHRQVDSYYCATWEAPRIRMGDLKRLLCPGGPQGLAWFQPQIPPALLHLEYIHICGIKLTYVNFLWQDQKTLNMKNSFLPFDLSSLHIVHWVCALGIHQIFPFGRNTCSTIKINTLLVLEETLTETTPLARWDSGHLHGLSYQQEVLVRNVCLTS